MASNEIQVGDVVLIHDEFDDTVEGTVVSTEAWGQEGQYAIGNDDWSGCYTRPANEIEKA